MLPIPIIESKYCTSIKWHMFFPGRQIELFCECRMPETYDNMIQCDQCCTWFHIKCMNLQCIPNECTVLHKLQVWTSCLNVVKTDLVLIDTK